MYEEQPIEGEGVLETGPRPFSEVPGLWFQIIQMTEGFFAQEAPRASNTSTLIGVLLFAVASAILAALTALISGGISMALGETSLEGTASLGNMVLCSACFGLIVTPISFYLNNGLTYLGARIFGGTGNFTTQAYLQSLFVVPLGIVLSAISLASAIPTVGGCITGAASLVVGIYSIILNVRAVKVAHDLTTGRAIGAILAPGVLILIVVGIAVAVIVLLALMGPAVGNIFEDIVTTI
jgi:hypothetical protein